MAALELVVTAEQAGRTVKSLLRGELGLSLRTLHDPTTFFIAHGRPAQLVALGGLAPWLGDDILP